MIRSQELFKGAHVSVVRLDHEPHSDHDDPEEEICSQHAINFVETGSFGLAERNESWRLTRDHVFISQPGAVHRYSHLERSPSDVCLSVIYLGIFTDDEKHPLHSVPRVFRCTNRLAFLKYRVAQLTRDGYSIGWEDWAVELAAAVGAAPELSMRCYGDRQLRWYAERVEAVRELFETRYSEAHSLLSVARSIGMSPFQFCRVFAELVGTPPHRYLLDVRLNRAAQLLSDGKPVTETCFDVGFSNLSHFTRSFQRRFGCVPSSIKSRPLNSARGNGFLAFRRKPS